MQPLACANVAAFPLQLLLKKHPEWTRHPVAVVTEDKPQGLILYVNEKARKAGVLPGFRYAAAFGLASGLRAGKISDSERSKAVGSVTSQLVRFTPEVEPCTEEPGLFWLNGRGLNLLYSSLQQWAHAIYSGIAAEGFEATVVTGFSRFGTYAVAKAEKGIVVFTDSESEQKTVEDVPLDRLNLQPEVRDTLLKLGIQTVGSFLSLPSAGFRERFGPDAHRLYQMARGELWTRFDAHKPEEIITQRYLLDDAENDTTRLLFLIKQLLHPILAALAVRTQACAALTLSFLVGRQGWLKEQIRPAAPTLDLLQLMDLVRLRLESMKFPAGVTEVELVPETYPATPEQLRLFAERPTRDFDAANRALARLRAEFGDEAVSQAKLADGHLPEARFTWEPLARVKFPQPKKGTSTLIRRIRAKPLPLSSGPQPTHEDGWLALGPKYGSVDKLVGPYIFSGGWWNREIQRDYYFAETRRGDLMWIYYDRLRRRWFLQGSVE